MKISLARTDLLDSLTIVSRGLSSRSTLPILSGVLVTADKGEVVLTTTDLEVSVRCTKGAAVDRPGQTVLPGRLLSDITRNLPEAAVTIDLEGESAHLSCGNASFSLKTLQAADFPKFPDTESGETIEIPSELFVSVVKQVSRAVSRDETRAILTGILTTLENGRLRLVATDSYRLAVREVSIDTQATALEAVIPGRAMDEVARLVGQEEKVALGISENQAVFSFGNAVFVTRRIEGSFPNYKQLIPKESETVVRVGRNEMAEAVKRVSLMAQHNSPLRMKIDSESGTMSLSAMTPDVGEASDSLMAEVRGPDVEIAFNHAFLTDGLNAAGSDEVEIGVVSPLKPGVLRTTGDEDYLYLLMPVRLG